MNIVERTQHAIDMSHKAGLHLGLAWGFILGFLLCWAFMSSWS